MKYDDTLKRIENALAAATETLKAFTPGRIGSTLKQGGDPVTEADVMLDKVLKAELLCDGEGWLSEETADDLSRLDKDKVWIVDPLDGTREFIQGIPEWCVSIAYVVDGRPRAAGICNPAAGRTILGTAESGVTLNGKSAKVSDKAELNGATILASRSEVNRGQWEWVEKAEWGCEVIAMGSVAYKLGLTAVGLADATFTLVPKNEWDIAAGVLLVEAGGGFVINKDGSRPKFNQPKTLTSGLIACGKNLENTLKKKLKPQLNNPLII